MKLYYLLSIYEICFKYYQTNNGKFHNVKKTLITITIATITQAAAPPLQPPPPTTTTV
jgi:hypothetical protein